MHRLVLTGFIGECVLVGGRLKELDGHATETMKRSKETMKTTETDGQ